MTEIDPVQLWVDALRSGDYTQTKGALRRKNNDGTSSYCCLGVACDLYADTVGGMDVELSDTGVYCYDPAGSNSYGVLPYSVIRWLGLSSPTGEFTPSDAGIFGRSSLASQNDRGVTFDEIARIIESRPEGLFEVAA